jgi:DNA-binding XRE family transcriptional regulator
MTQTTFAKALRAERRRMELTQGELADKIGTSQQNVAAWEASKSLPRPELHEELVKVFGKHSVIAALPPRGEIPGGDEILRANQAIYTADLSARNATPAQPAATPLSAFATAIGVLFDALPEDQVVRATVFSDVTTTILKAGRAPEPVEAPAPAPTPRKQRA